MFKKFIAAALLALVIAPGVLFAVSDNPTSKPDHWRLSHRDPMTGADTETASINYYGAFLPGQNQRQDVGSPTQTWRHIYGGTLDITSGIVNVHETWIDIPAADSDSIRTNGFDISTKTLAESGTTYTTNDFSAQPTHPRNLFIVAGTTDSAAMSSVTGNITFYGIDNLGKSNSETIHLTTNTRAGNIAWATLSSFTVAVTNISDMLTAGMANTRLFVGTTNQIGLSNDITASGDVYKTLEAAADSTSGAAPNATYDTILFVLPPNGSRDFEAWSKAKKSTP